MATQPHAAKSHVSGRATWVKPKYEKTALSEAAAAGYGNFTYADQVTYNAS